MPEVTGGQSAIAVTTLARLAEGFGCRVGTLLRLPGAPLPRHFRKRSRRTGGIHHASGHQDPESRPVNCTELGGGRSVMTVPTALFRNLPIAQPAKPTGRGLAQADMPAHFLEPKPKPSVCIIVIRLAHQSSTHIAAAPNAESARLAG